MITPSTLERNKCLKLFQERFDAEDAGIELGDADAQECARNWECFKEAAKDGGLESQRTRMKLVKDIRSKLKEYSKKHPPAPGKADTSVGKALVLESTLACLGPPPARTFDAIHHAVTHYDEKSRKREPILEGYSSTLYTTNTDLVVLKQGEFEDRFTAFVQRYLPILFMVSRRRC